MDKILQIQNEVFLRRPVLKEILQTHGSDKLKTYVNNWPVFAGEVDKDFLEILENEAGEIYGQKIAGGLVKQLREKPLISTIDHLGIWNHPIFVNSDVIFSLHFNSNEFVPVLATESVSLNNSSSWSASLLWHDDNLMLKRFSFLPDKQKGLPVFSCPAISAGNLEQFVVKTKNKFKNLIEVLGLSEEKNLSIQACKASARFWEKVFPCAPKLLYLPLETIVSKYLIKIFTNEENPITKIISTEAGRKIWSKYFADEHTFMFWGIDKKGRRQSIKSIEEDFNQLLQSGQIYPSSPLCFMVLLFCGLTCAGGFTQTTWLSEVSGKFSKMLSEMGQSAAAQKVESVFTRNFAESVLAVLKIRDKFIFPSGVDLFFSGKDFYTNYIHLAENLTLAQSLNLAMPTIYSVVVPKADKVSVFNLESMQQELFFLTSNEFKDMISMKYHTL